MITRRWLVSDKEPLSVAMLCALAFFNLSTVYFLPPIVLFPDTEEMQLLKRNNLSSSAVIYSF